MTDVFDVFMPKAMFRKTRSRGKMLASVLGKLKLAPLLG
jgi:hypothetical protein